MRYLVRALWLIIFLVLFAFAVANTEPSVLHLYGEYNFSQPLVIWLLIFFVSGFVFGVLALIPGMIRMRIELRKLRRLAIETPVVVAGNGHPVAPDSIQTVAQGARTTS
jgi:putative membrane protein